MSLRNGAEHEETSFGAVYRGILNIDTFQWFRVRVGACGKEVLEAHARKKSFLLLEKKGFNVIGSCIRTKESSCKEDESLEIISQTFIFEVPNSMREH